MSATSVEKRIPLADAIEMANRAADLFTGVVDRLQIAGSIRRGKRDVGDIELVVATSDDRIDLLCDRLCLRGVVSKRLNKAGDIIAWGDKAHYGVKTRYKAMLFEEFPLDLFIVRPDRSWGATLLIRTGPGDANEVLVTQQGKRNRNGDNGILPVNMRFKGGLIYRDGIALDTPEEIDVFREVGLPYIQPEDRSVATYHRMALLKNAIRVVGVYFALPDTHLSGAIDVFDDRLFAPTSDAAHDRERYLDLMRLRYRDEPERFNELLNQRQIVLCGDPISDILDHRRVVTDILAQLGARNNIRVEYKGETRVIPLPDPENDPNGYFDTLFGQVLTKSNVRESDLAPIRVTGAEIQPPSESQKLRQMVQTLEWGKRIAEEFRTSEYQQAKTDGERAMCLAKARYFENGGVDGVDPAEEAAAYRAIASAHQMLHDEIDDEMEQWGLRGKPEFSARAYERARRDLYLKKAEMLEQKGDL